MSNPAGSGVKLRAASTVIVARPAGPESAFEIFMVRRSAKSAFVPDMFVFPGGALDPVDFSPEMVSYTFGLDSEQARHSLRDEPEAGAWSARLDLTAEQQLGLYVAALRELFEEAGVLLAVEAQTGSQLDISSNPQLRTKFSAYRDQMQKGELSFLQMLEQAAVRADLSRLTYFSHWITPVTENRRYDTHFFLATAPANQQAEADLFETTEGVWITPAAALERYKAGSFGLIYPTIQHLKRLAAQPNLAALQEYARTKPIVSAMPDVTTTEDGKFRFALRPEVLERW